MPTQMAQIKPLVLVKYEFEYREKIKLMFSLVISDCHITDAGEKNNDFSVEDSSTGVEFSIEFLTEEIELVVAEF